MPESRIVDLAQSANLSLCGLALLGVIVDGLTVERGESMPKGVTLIQLQDAVPPQSRIDTFPGILEDWPHDISAWVDELQTLLDHGLIVRHPTRRRYEYLPTLEGVRRLTAALHPRAATRGMVA